MNVRSFLARFMTDRSAASAAEFALVVPTFLLLFLGTIDVGRFIWHVNENEKAAQIGARWAVVTDIIPGGEEGCGTIGATEAGLRCFSYAINGITPQGLTVPAADFPTVTCEAPTGTLACSCDGDCPFSTDIDSVAQASFDRIVGRMNAIQPRLNEENVVVRYEWSGLGYSGDPTGPDVAPLVTVQVQRLSFRPLFLAGFLALGIPGAQYSLTMEDGDGTYGN